MSAQAPVTIPNVSARKNKRDKVLPLGHRAHSLLASCHRWWSHLACRGLYQSRDCCDVVVPEATKVELAVLI